MDGRSCSQKNRNVKNWTCALAKVKEHLYGKEYLDGIDACREKLNSIEVDRTARQAHRQDHR